MLCVQVKKTSLLFLASSLDVSASAVFVENCGGKGSNKSQPMKINIVNSDNLLGI